MNLAEFKKIRGESGDEDTFSALLQIYPALQEFQQEGFQPKEILDTIESNPDILKPTAPQPRELPVATSEIPPTTPEGPSGSQIVAGIAANVAISEGAKVAGTALGAKAGTAVGAMGGPTAPATVPAGATLGAGIGYVSGSLIGGASGSIAQQKIEGQKDISYGRVIADSLLNLVPGAGELKSGPRALRAMSKVAARNKVKTTAAMGAVMAPTGVAIENLYNRGELGDADELVTASAMGLAFGGGLGYANKKSANILKRLSGKTTTELNRAVYGGDADAVSFVDIVTKDVDPNKFLQAQDAKTYLTNLGRVVDSRIRPSKVVGEKAAQAMRTAKNVTMAGREIGGILGERIDSKIRQSADPEATMQLASEFVTGKTKTVPPELQDLANDLSEARKFVKEYQEKILAQHHSGEKPLPDLLRQQIEQSVTEGSYLTRTYRFFDDPNWRPTEKMRNAALKELQDDGMKFDEAQAYLANLNTKRASSDEEILSTVYSSDPRIMRQRKDISPALREYLGEYITPGEQVRATMSALSRHTAYAQADSEITKALQSTGLLKTATEELPEGFAPIKLRTGKAMAGESELYGPPELQRAINELYASKVDNAIEDVATKTATDLWESGIALSKAVKVLGNPPAYLVQLYGNVSQLLGMGMNPFKGLGSGLKAAKGQFADMSGKVANMSISDLKEFKRLKELGMVPSSLQFADVQAGLQQGKFGKTVQKAIDPLGKVYSVPDVALRVSAFKNYGKFLAKASPAAPKDKAEKLAAIYTNNTYPNYDYINSSLKTLSRKGVPLSQFASFTLEMLRTQYNQGKLVFRMLKEPERLAKEMADELGAPVDKRVLQVEGLKRLASLSALYAGSAYGINQFNRQGGVSEEKEQAYRRTVLAEWDENRPLLIRETKDGKVESINASYLVPHMQMAAPALAAIRGESFDEAVGKAVRAFGEDIVGEGSFMMNAVVQALNNKSFKSGQAISTQPDGIKKAAEIGEWFIKDVSTPGISREIEKARANPIETTALRQAGIRINTTTVEDGFRYKTKALKESINMAQKEVAYAKAKMDKGEFTPNQFAEKYERANSAYKANMLRLIAHVKDLRALGKNENEIFKMMREYGVGAERAIDAYDGIVEDLPATKPLTTADQYDEIISQVGKKGVMKEFYKVAKTNPQLAESLVAHHKRVLMDERLNISEREKTLRSLDSSDGSRARFIFREMTRNPGKESQIRQAYIRKGIINANVARQLKVLEEASGRKKSAGQTPYGLQDLVPTR